MVTVVLDTSIVVDLISNYPNALKWSKGQVNQILSVTTVVMFEILDESLNRADLQRKQKFLQQFAIVETTQQDLNWAYKQFSQYYLSHGIDYEDCMIAAPCHRLNLTLYTRNLKHFAPILGTLAQAPY